MNDFDRDCLKERGRILTGRGAHYCHDWDGLTVDETTREWSCCSCFPRTWWMRVCDFFSRWGCSIGVHDWREGPGNPCLRCGQEDA
jgi:hypothetical protein